MDKKIRLADEISHRLIKLLNVLKKLDAEVMLLFKNWFKKIILKPLPENDRKKIETIIDEEKEVEIMVYAIEKAIKEEFNKQHDSGVNEAEEKARQNYINSAKKLLTKKFGILTAETTQKLEAAKSDDLLQIIDNIFDIENLNRKNGA